MKRKEARTFKNEVLEYRKANGFPEDIFELRLFAIHMIDWARRNIEGYEIKKRQADKVPAQ